ncbi:TRAP transporter small permease [Enterocloster citroniae]|uniref:TRAP transporter small permease n=1 Tax=Enterocloster citroniae TaxID=358743 RepID=UPI0032C0B15B
MLKKLSDFIYKITGVFISVDLAVIVVLSFSQVVSRYVFSFSISWAQELVTYLLVWLVFMGCCMGLRDNEVAALTIVVDKLSPSMKKTARILVQVLLIMFCVVSFWANQEIIANMWNKKSSILRMNLGYVSLAFSVSNVIIIFNAVLEIGNILKSLIVKPGEEDKE